MCLFLTSDLAVDPPEGSFGHAMELNKNLSDPAWLQGEDKLLLQLPDVHTGRSCRRTRQNIYIIIYNKSQVQSHVADIIPLSRNASLGYWVQCCTWNVVEGRKGFSAEVDRGRPLPHLLH